MDCRLYITIDCKCGDVKKTKTKSKVDDEKEDPLKKWDFMKLKNVIVLLN